MRLYDPAAGEFLHSIEESYARAHALDDERAARHVAEQRARAAEEQTKAAQEAADSRIAALEAQLRTQRQPD